MRYVTETVSQIRKELGTRDPCALARALGIEIEEFPFKKIKGALLRLAGKPVIVLNSNLPEWLKRFVVAHELGHEQLAPKGAGYYFFSENTCMEPKVEYQANRFAAEYLCGEERPEEGEALEHFAARVGVPKEMLEWKLIR